jgi:hypothetical protein
MPPTAEPGSISGAAAERTVTLLMKVASWGLLVVVVIGLPLLSQQ